MSGNAFAALPRAILSSDIEYSIEMPANFEQSTWQSLFWLSYLNDVNFTYFTEVNLFV